MHLFKKIENFCLENNLLTPGSHLLVGFSGGPDSLFLAHFLIYIRSTLSLNITLAHLDHGWRASSSKDVQFCLDFAKNNNIPIIQGKAENFSSQLKFNGSREEFGRNIRQAFFKEALTESRAANLVLAHHADDQLETFFIRLARGATTAGLKCMEPIDGNIVRPLLAINKTEILTFLHTHNIAYCVDETNDSDLFLRNRIRHHLIPAGTAIDRRFVANSMRTITHLAQVEAFLKEETVKRFKEIKKVHQATLYIDYISLLLLSLFMQKRCIMHWLCTEKPHFTPSESLIVEIIRFLSNQKSKVHTFNGWSIIKDKQMAHISTKK